MLIVLQDRRVHGFEISRQQITPSTDDLRVDIGRFNRGELTLAETAQLTDNQRIAYVQKLLGIDELNENQARAILAAHYSDLADVSSYRRLRVKEDILREVFDKNEVSLMMRKGVTGKALTSSLNDKFSSEIENFRRMNEGRKKIYSSTELKEMGVTEEGRTFRRKLINLIESPPQKDVSTDKVAYLLPQFSKSEFTGEFVTVTGRRFKVYRGTPVTGGADVYYIVDRTAAHMHDLQIGRSYIPMPRHIDVQKNVHGVWRKVREDNIDWETLVRESHAYDILDYYSR